MLVCVGDAFEILFLKFVLFRVGIRIAAAPEVFDKFFALVVCCEFGPCVALGFRENEIDVIEPVDVRLFEFL
jgi:hypothetical protein